MGILLQDEAGYMIILMCKLTADRADGWEGYLGFARTSWYGTSDIQITHTKRTFGYIQIGQTKRTSTQRVTLVFEVPSQG